LKNVSPLDRQAVVRKVLRDVTATLAHRMHARGWVHRDLKATNILIDGRQGTAHLADFGLAARLVDGRVDGLGGSFVSPEMLTDDASALAGDMWSLGCLIVPLYTAPYASRCRSPFRVQRKPDGRPDWTNLLARMRAFEVWRDAQPRDADGQFDVRRLVRDAPRHVSGRFDFERLDAEGPPWRGMFVRLALNDEAVCRIVLEQLLCLQPARRVTAQQFLAFLDGLAAENPNQTAQAVRALQALGRSQPQKTALTYLNRYRQVLLAGSSGTQGVPAH
jgi:serine/threonine protein kinase